MNRESTAAAEKLSDEALSRQLGRCQRVEAIFMLLCIASVIACVLVLWVWQKKLLACALLAVGAAGGLIAGAAQRQRRALLDAQLGDFYRAELDRAFGPEGRSPELRIDEAWLHESRLVDRLWEKCELRCFREGVYRGMRFSAADGALAIRERVEEHPCGDLSDPAAFAARYTVCGRDGEAAEAAPQLREMFKELERVTAGEMESAVLRDGTLSIALNTKYAFAEVPAQMDMRDLGAVRKWYTATLQGMCRILDVLLKSGLPAAE